jgi:hypothetical protein
MKEYEMNDEDECYKDAHHHLTYYDIAGGDSQQSSRNHSMMPPPSESAHKLAVRQTMELNNDDDMMSMKDGKDISFIDRMDGGNGLGLG